jgi:CheY-like chemotaxis protein
MNSYAIMLQTDADDRYITESILADLNNTIPVKFISDANELENIIEMDGQPTVILINDSFSHTAAEQLKQLKTHPSFNHIPVVVLGEMVTDEYIRQYYRDGANTYIIKPSTIAGTKTKIEGFFKYWFDVAEV